MVAKEEVKRIYPLSCVVQRPDARRVNWGVLFSQRKWEVEARLLYDGRDGGTAESSEIIHLL
jgi:hypothetical protein